MIIQRCPECGRVLGAMGRPTVGTVAAPGDDCSAMDCQGSDEFCDPSDAVCRPDYCQPYSKETACNPASWCWHEKRCAAFGGVPGSKQPGPVPGKKIPDTKTPDTTVPDTTVPDSTPPAPKPSSNAGLIFGAIALAVAGFGVIGYASGMFDGD